MTEAHAMTAAQATTFANRSLKHEVILAETADEKGCTCAAYRDWFTYRRWQALGFQVQKGEHGVKLTTWITYEDKDGKERSRPKGTTVFCRCQVKPKGT